MVKMNAVDVQVLQVRCVRTYYLEANDHKLTIPENAHELLSFDTATAECWPVNGTCYAACF
jgi:hypothetical protein